VTSTIGGLGVAGYGTVQREGIADIVARSANDLAKSLQGKGRITDIAKPIPWCKVSNNNRPCRQGY